MYVCGSEAVIDYCRSSGVDLCDEMDCDNLVISMDVDYNYEKMTRAVRAALKAENIMVCNQDKLFSTEEGVHPGCGAIVSSILFVTNKKPNIVIGKPSTIMIDYIAKKYGLEPEDIVVIGDGKESDIQMAKDYGSRYIFIGEDVKTIKDIAEWNY